MTTYEVKRHKGGLVATFDTQEEAANYIQSKDDPALYVDVGNPPPEEYIPNDYANKSKYEGGWVHTPFKELFLKFKILHYVFLGIFTLNLVGSVASGTFISGGYLLGLTEFTLGYACVVGVLMFVQRSQFVLTKKGEADYKEGAKVRAAEAAVKEQKTNDFIAGVFKLIFIVIGVLVVIWFMSDIPAIPLAIIVGALIIATAILSKKGQ